MGEKPQRRSTNGEAPRSKHQAPNPRKGGKVIGVIRSAFCGGQIGRSIAKESGDVIEA